MMLVVMCITTGQSVIAADSAESCCCKANKNGDSCSESEQKKCSNEGNPFQFCSCCVHALIPVQTVTFETVSYPPAAVIVLQIREILPEVFPSKFWQPPRFS